MTTASNVTFEHRSRGGQHHDDRTRHCADCGREIETGIRCPDCLHGRHLNNQLAGGPWELVACPPDSDLRVGAMFGKDDVEKYGSSWAVGCAFRHMKTGAIITVGRKAGRRTQ